MDLLRVSLVLHVLLLGKGWDLCFVHSVADYDDGLPFCVPLCACMAWQLVHPDDSNHVINKLQNALVFGEAPQVRILLDGLEKSSSSPP